MRSNTTVSKLWKEDQRVINLNLLYNNNIKNRKHYY